MIEWLKPLAGAAEQGGHGWSWGLRGYSDAEELSPLLFWTYLGVSIGLVTMAGMASGLTLGLMSLDELDLEVGAVHRAADEKELVPRSIASTCYVMFQACTRDCMWHLHYRQHQAAANLAWCSSCQMVSLFTLTGCATYSTRLQWYCLMQSVKLRECM
jgi:hypothetical protein